MTHDKADQPRQASILLPIAWKLTLIACALTFLAAGRAEAAIPDADIRRGVNTAGFGMIDGVFGRADFALDDRSAVGGYFGANSNDLSFGDFEDGDQRFRSDALVGGHYMYQFVEGSRRTPSVSGIFGAFADRHELRPELGIALSHPLSERLTGRANVVYGPSWGVEVGYRFSPSVEGTIGVTGLGLLGLGFRF
jgi:hypothetical protein